MKLIIVIVASFLFYSGCSCSCGSSDDLNIELEMIKIDSWFNMMPGPSAPTYHIAGEIRIKNEEKEELNLSLGEVIVTQKGRELYRFKPFFIFSHYEEVKPLKKGEEEIFMWGTGEGLRINDNHNSSENVDAVLNFSANGKPFSYEIKDILVENIY
jgi:hypothetical protein